MNKSVCGLALATLIAGVALAQSSVPTPILPDSLRYSSNPLMPGAESAQIIGEPQKSGPYLQRVKLAAGARIPPHTHPDERNSTVLSGTIYVGFGETFDESKLVAIPTGAVYIAPAGVPHYIWAKDGPAVYQEGGNGPTGAKFLGR